MDLFYYVGAIFVYAILITFLTLKISKTRKKSLIKRVGKSLKCDREDLINSKHLFKYNEDGTLTIDNKKKVSPKKEITNFSKIRNSKKEELAEDIEKNSDELDEKVINLVIDHLLNDNFMTFYNFLTSGNREEILKHIHLLTEFRNDERFIMVVSEMLSHKFPEVQLEMRKILEKYNDDLLMEELVNLSINQTHTISQKIMDGISDESEISKLEKDELILLIRKEKDENKLLQYIDALMKFNDPETDEIISYATDKILGFNPKWSSRNKLFIPEGLGNEKSLSFKKKMTLARVGVGFKLENGRNYLRVLSNDYKNNATSDDIYEAVKDDNEFIRGRALLTLSKKYINSQTYYVLINKLNDLSSYVRVCAVQALDEFVRFSRNINLIENTKDIRNKLLSHITHEKDRDVIVAIERMLFKLENNSEKPLFAPISSPELIMPPYLYKNIEYSDVKLIPDKKKSA